MTPSQANTSIKKLNAEISSLTPSALISLYEIDISDIAFDEGVALQNNQTIFRFHSVMKLINTNIFWQGNEYIAAPIRAEGFEINSKGTLPTPKLAMTVNDGGIALLAALKVQLKQLDDLTGAKVTRIRTFAKCLDSNNFLNNDAPPGFSPDPNMEFPRDVYFIDRKSTENKNTIEFQLASILDVENILLPGRLVLANRCSWIYRGEGCLYAGNPVADPNDNKITDLLNIPAVNPRGLWLRNVSYNYGDAVYVTKNNISYYFVSKVNGNTIQPPNDAYWISDICSKLFSGCRLRFSGLLPTSAFAGADKVH